MMVRYSFHVGLFHPLPDAGLSRRSACLDSINMKEKSEPRRNEEISKISIKIREDLSNFLSRYSFKEV